MTRIAAPLALLMIATGCPQTPTPTPDGSLDDGFESRLSITTACSDTSFHAWSDDGGTALSVASYQFLDRSAAVDDTHYAETLEIGVDEVTVWVDLGTDVYFNFCTDALTQLEITDSYTAVSGTVELEVDWPTDGTDIDPTGSFTLTDVVFEDDTGHQVTLDSFGDDALQITRYWGG